MVILFSAGILYEWFSSRKLVRKTFLGKTFVEINGKLNLSSSSRLIRAENNGHIVQVGDENLLIDVINTHLTESFK